MRYGNADGYYELQPFPGNPDVVVSKSARIFPHKRGRGLGQRQHSDRLDKAQQLGYSVIVATVRKDNEVERHILKKYGWKEVCDIIPRESSLWVKELYPET